MTTLHTDNTAIEAYLTQFAERRAKLISMQANPLDCVLYFKRAHLGWHRPTDEAKDGWACGVEHASIFSRGVRIPAVRNGAGEVAILMKLEDAITDQIAQIDLAVQAVTSAMEG